MLHSIDLGADHVVKYFGDDEPDGHRRELLALTLLAEHVPGIAPVPLPPHGGPLVLRMTRIPGEPLRGTRIDARRTAALAAAVGTLFDAVPREEVDRVPPRADGADRVTAWLREDSAVGPRCDDPLVAAAAAEGTAWLRTADLALPDGVRRVFGPGDGNLANYLWDGERVRVVDFESCGRSDRAYELAEITEHVSAWSPADLTAGITGGTALDAGAFLAHFDLTAAEAARLADCRRLLALAWLVRLSYDDPEHPRNPPGTARRQALRLRERLEC